MGLVWVNTAFEGKTLHAVNLFQGGGEHKWGGEAVGGITKVISNQWVSNQKADGPRTRTTHSADEGAAYGKGSTQIGFH